MEEARLNTDLRPAEKILVVDDQVDNRAVLEAYLGSAGYAILFAESGEEAVARFEDGDVDLVLMDVVMPGIDGFEACRRIRALRSGAKMPIIFLTAPTDAATQMKPRDLGAADFIAKPVNRTELLMRVRSLLWMRRLTDDLRQGHELIRSQHDAGIWAQQSKEGLINLVVAEFQNPIA